MKSGNRLTKGEGDFMSFIRLKRKIIIGFCFVFFCLLSINSFCGVSEFDLRNPTIKLSELRGGGPRKGGIPAITKPRIVFTKHDKFIKDTDIVIGVVVKGKARAYPISILNWHEIVNDFIWGKSITVTWCPLTASGIVFERKIDGKVLEFGVSGLLYNSNLVMYDKETESLWPQLSLGAVTGKFSNHRLKIIPSIVITWGEWLEMHPNTQLSSQKTGFIRRYEQDPYIEYHKSPSAMFKLKNADKRLPQKAMVIGIRIGNTAKAYPMSVAKGKNVIIDDVIEGQKIKIHFNSKKTAYMYNKEGELLPAIRTYWFAWSNFNKDTLIFEN